MYPELSTYVLADENDRVLSRTGALDSPFISLIGKAVDQLGEFGSTEDCMSSLN